MKKETSAPYSSAQMGLIERTHHTLMSQALASLSSAKLPQNMWGEMMLTETYIKNRTLTSAFRVPEQTPHERWTGIKPDLSHMREIGCRAFVLKLPKVKNPKIFNRSVECVMIGYSPSLEDTYHCYECKTGRVHLTCNVEFIESQDEVPRPLTPAQTAKKPTPQKPLDEVLVNPTTKTLVHPDLDPYQPESESEDEDEGDTPEPVLEDPRPQRTQQQ
jgi:hypothetical protein